MMDPVALPTPGSDLGHSIRQDSTVSAPVPTSPGIAINFIGGPGHVQSDATDRPALTSSASAPVPQPLHSPLRHHRRTPSAHREIKETLNARSEYLDHGDDGSTQQRINQYTIGDEIGRGSYGSVRRAVDQFGTEYAVKEFSKARLRKRAQSNILKQGPHRPGRFPGGPRAGLHPNYPDIQRQAAAEKKDSLALIRHEIAIMKKLHHPNLVQLIEVLDDRDADSLYMVLEICKGGVVMKVGLGETADPYPEEQCRHWFRDLILGIEYLHAQGIVHRDIKPDNLLLSDDNVLKIVDFGVSEMFGKGEDPNMMTAKSAGSPAFLPPELCVARHGDVSGKAADIWSMGVSLYCLRYGRIPFEEEGIIEMYEAIRTKEPYLPPDENPDLVDLMHRILEKDPNKRIQMAELREHPWVTKRGQDPLLSAEENCANPVDPPNALEVNHAFTRKMSHLLCVMKAISKFKALLARSRQAGRKRTTHAGSGDDEGSSQAASTPQSPDPESKAANAEAAAALVRLRRERSLRETTAAGNFSGIATALGHLGGTDGTVEDSAKGTQPGSPGNANGGVLAESSGRSPLILGIGTGGQDDFATFAYDSDEEPPPPANVVSDSPAVVDFNVYDAAYGAEVARIRAAAAAEAAASTSGGGRRGSRQRTDSVGAGAASAPTTTVYLTRLVENPPVNDGDAIVMKADAGSDRDGEDHKMRDCADTVLHDTAVEGPQSQTEARPQATLPTAATTAAAAWSPVDTPGTADSRDLRSSSSAVPSANALSGSSFQDIVAQAMKNKAAM